MIVLPLYSSRRHLWWYNPQADTIWGYRHNNKRMIAEWRQQKYKTPEEYYIDSRLTDAVYEDSTFAAQIKDIVRESIKNAKGRIETLVIKEKDISGLRRPTFSIGKDKGRGLTFALNDTWGFRVTLLG